MKIASPSAQKVTDNRLDGCLGKSVVVAGMMLAATVFPGCSKSPAKPIVAVRENSIPVTVAPVELTSLDRTLDIVGTLHPRNEATVGAQVEGQVEKTLVDFGELVVAGQDLALIDTASYEALAAQAAAAVAKAKANALNAEQNLRRVVELQQSKISSASDLDGATAMAEQTRAEVKAVEAAEAIARLNLRRSHVTAPFDGSVSERIANTGDYVKTAAPLFRLVQDRELKFIVQVPEKYAAQVKPDLAVHLTVDAWPGEVFQGKVFLISPSVNTATRSFNVGTLVPNPDRKLKANTFARGELVLQQAVPTPVIPLEAVLNFAGVTKVFVIENNAARSREISAGRIHNGQQEVLEGLKPGETVALTGITKLFDNAKVRILAPEAKTASR